MVSTINNMIKYGSIPDDKWLGQVDKQWFCDLCFVITRLVIDDAKALYWSAQLSKVGSGGTLGW